MVLDFNPLKFNLARRLSLAIWAVDPYSGILSDQLGLLTTRKQRRFKVRFEIRNLRHFIALMNYRSFALAADSVHLSQPAFSRSIQALEAQAGCTLVERSVKGLPPTYQGQVVLNYALEIIGKADELGHTLRRYNKQSDTLLRFGCGPVAASSLVPRALARVLNREHLHAQYVVDTWPGLNRRLMAGEIEFFITNALHFEHDSQYRVLDLLPRPWGLYCRSGHVLAIEPMLTAARLLDYPLACTTGVTGLVGSYLGRDDYLPNIQCDNGHAMLDLVLGSDTIGCSTLLPAITKRLDQKPGVRLLRPVDMPESLAAIKVRNGVVSLKSSPLSLQAQTLIEEIALVDSETSV